MLRSSIVLSRTVRSNLVNRSSVRFASLISDQSANIGDYPTSIPAINRQTRSETAKWDNQQERRNFGETVLRNLFFFCYDVHGIDCVFLAS